MSATCDRARWDLPQHWRWRGAGRPPLAVNTPPRAPRAPAPRAPRRRPPRPRPGALHVHAMHSLFMAATTLCFYAGFLAPVTSAT